MNIISADFARNYFRRIPTYVITVHQHYRQTDRQTKCYRNTALCTKVHRAVKSGVVFAKNTLRHVTLNFSHQRVFYTATRIAYFISGVWKGKMILAATSTTSVNTGQHMSEYCHSPFDRQNVVSVHSNAS